MGYNDKETGGGFDITANEMLRRLNNQYKADKFSDKYAENEEYIRSGDGSVQIDISSLSDEEFKILFDSYMASSNMTVNTDMTESTYKSLRYHIINLQKKSGALLVTEKEMENRFEDAESAKKNRYDYLDSLMESDDEPEAVEEPKAIEEPGVIEEPEVIEEPKVIEEPEAIEEPEVIEEPKAIEEPEVIEAPEGSEEAEVIEAPKPIEDFTTFEDHRTDYREYNTYETRSADTDTDMKISEDDEHAVTAVIGRVPEMNDDGEHGDDDFQETVEYSKFAKENEETEVSEAADTAESDDAEKSEERGGLTEEEKRKLTIFARLKLLMGEENDEDIVDSYSILGDDFQNTDMMNLAEDEVEEGYGVNVTENREEDEETDDFGYQNPGFDAIPDEIPGEVIPEAPNFGIIDDIADEEPVSGNADIVDAFEKAMESEKENEPDDAEETAETEEEPLDNDYVSFEQNDKIFGEYKKKYASARIRTGICAAIAFILLIVENIGILGVTLPGFIGSMAFLVPFEWALVFACAFLVSDKLIGAVKSLVKLRFEPALVTLIAFVWASASTFSALFAGENVRFFNFTFALCVLVNLISVYIGLRKEIFTFKVLSSSRRKNALTLMSEKESATEARDFADYLSERSEFYCVEKADFIDGYFNKKNKTSVMSKKNAIIVMAALAVSAILAVVSAIVKDSGVYGSLTNGYVAFAMCAPFAVFFASELPLYLGAIRAYSYNSAVLGDSAPAMMENMSVVSLTDSDVFKADGVKIKGVKVIDENRIDHIIHYATSVFDIIGGPLSKVFRQAAIDDSKPESAEVRVISSKGVDAMVDGKHIVLGAPSFMEAQCFKVVKEAGDEQWEGKTNKRILYLACDEEVIAKFYVEYNVSPDFVYTVKKLVGAGICVAVRTNDPCVDTDLFYRNKISTEQYPISVIKGAGKTEPVSSVPAKKVCIVTAGSVKGMVKTVLLCDRITSVMNTNFVIKAVSAFIGLLIMAFVIIFGPSAFGAWSLYFALYQMLWIAATYLMSKIYM